MVVPLEDLREAAGYRLAQDLRVREYAQIVARLNVQIGHLEDAAQGYEAIIARKDEIIDAQRVEGIERSAKALKCERQKRTNKTWAWIGTAGTLLGFGAVAIMTR